MNKIYFLLLLFLRGNSSNKGKNIEIIEKNFILGSRTVSFIIEKEIPTTKD